jgi:hypothetical protein
MSSFEYIQLILRLPKLLNKTEIPLIPLRKHIEGVEMLIHELFTVVLARSVWFDSLSGRQDLSELNTWRWFGARDIVGRVKKISWPFREGTNSGQIM